MEALDFVSVFACVCWFVVYFFLREAVGEGISDIVSSVFFAMQTN